MRKKKKPGRPAAPLSKHNARLLRRFGDSLIDLKEQSRINYIGLLMAMARKVEKPLDRLSKDDVLSFLNEYKKRAKPRSLKLMIISLKKLYGWLGKPEIMEEVKIPQIDDRDQKIYPTVEEFLKILEVTTNIRDKAFFACGYETATIGRAKKEWLNVKLRDVVLEDNVAYIKILESKTRARTVIVKKFIKELRDWLEIHPAADNPDAYLWVSLQGNRRGKKLSYQAMNNAFKRSCRKAGVPLYPLRSLRHRRAKDLEKVLSIREKMAYFGWRNINTAMVYGNFSSEEACETIIAAEEGWEIKRDEEALRSWKCPACKTDNQPNMRFCGNCTQPRDEALAIKKAITSVEEIADQVLAKLLQVLEEGGLIDLERAKALLLSKRESIKNGERR
jgi:integrase